MAGDADGQAPDGDAFAGVDPRARCVPTGRFSDPVPVEGINSPPTPAGVEDYGARLLLDELTVYFTRSLTGRHRIFRATRRYPWEAFGAPAPVDNLGLTAAVYLPTVTADDRSIYFESFDGLYRVFVANRDTPSDTFSLPRAVDLGPDVGDGGPYVLPEGDVLYFHSIRPGQGYNDIYRAIRTTVGITDVMPVPGINTAADESLPVVSPDEQLIFFTWMASPGVNVDIYTATRPNREHPFDPPSIVAELDSDQQQFPTWISPDGCRLYFARDSPAGYRMFRADRFPPGGPG